MTKKYMSVAELADYLGISKPSAYTLARRDDFPAIVIGERKIIVISELVDEWMIDQAAKKLNGEARV